MVRRRRRAARRCAWRSFSRLEMKCRRRRASCRTPSRCTSLLKRRTSCSESSPSRRVTCSTCVLSHRSAVSRQYTSASARNRSRTTLAPTARTEQFRTTQQARTRTQKTNRRGQPEGRAPPHTVRFADFRPSLHFVTDQTRIRIEAQGRLRLGRLIVALGRVPPRRSKLSGAPDTFSALAGSGHRTGQSLQIVVGRYRGCSRRFHDFSRRSKRGVPSSPPEPLALPGLRSDGNTTARRSHCKH